MREMISRIYCVALLACALMPLSCSHVRPRPERVSLQPLEEALEDVIKKVPGKAGVAVIYDSADTLAVNNSDDYPLMSMFKLHQAVAVCMVLDKMNEGLDTVLYINRGDLDPRTWSPMLKEQPAGDFRLSAGELLEYMLIHSDNNASNLLFDRIVSASATDSLIRGLEGCGDFRIVYKEADMKEDVVRSYDNRTSPLAYASLVNRLFTDSVVNHDKQEFVKQAMGNCNTGPDRLASPLKDVPGIAFAHRTGSGYVTPRGVVVAVNDGGYVTLPSGKGYSIAVFVKDYDGSQADAEKLIAEISRVVLDYFNKPEP